MSSQYDYYRVFKLGTSQDLIELYDSLPDAPLKLEFRSLISDNADDNKLNLTFGYLCSVYCNGTDIKIGELLSLALYKYFKELNDENNSFRSRVINYACDYISALYQMGKHSEVILLTSEIISWNADNTRFSFSDRLVGNYSYNPLFLDPSTFESKKEIFINKERKELENLILIKIMKGESLLALGKIDEAEKILKNDEVIGCSDHLVKLKRDNLSNSIKHYKKSVLLTKDEINKEKQQEEEREQTLRNSIDILKDWSSDIFSEEQSKSIAKGLESVFKNNPRVDLSNKEEREDFIQLRNIVDRKLSGKENEGDKLFRSELISKYSTQDRAINVKEKCPSCNGKGKYECPKCKGEGYILAEK